MLDTGTRPAAPAIDGLSGTPYWTNREVVHLTELPESLVVALGLVAAAVHAEIPVRQLRGMQFAYPDFHRAVLAALVDLDL